VLALFFIGADIYSLVTGEFGVDIACYVAIIPVAIIVIIIFKMNQFYNDLKNGKTR
jgi:hypothetical protein